MIVLTCPRCGAPLPHAASPTAAIVCAYCLASITTTSGITSAAPSAGVEAPPAPLGLRPEAAAYCTALGAALQAGGDPYESLRSLARTHLGSFGETDAMARVALALAADFEAETGIRVRSDGVAMSRLTDGYLRAIDTIRTRGHYELALRFFAADSKGPRDLVRTLDATTIAGLAARDPAATTKPKKRGFWPFS